MVLLRLIEAHCVPILTYGIEITHIANRDEARSLRVAYNAIFRRIFGYRLFESVSNVQRTLGRKTWEELTESRRSGFFLRLQASERDTLVHTLSQ